MDEVLTACGRLDAKPRPLSSRFMVCFVLALALFQQDSYDDVAENLVGALGEMDPSVRNKSSFTRARQQLGAAPLEGVFRRVAGAIAPPTLEAAFWRGMRVAAVDGFLLDVPKNDTTGAAFGGQVDRTRTPAAAGRGRGARLNGCKVSDLVRRSQSRSAARARRRTGSSAGGCASAAPTPPMPARPSWSSPPTGAANWREDDRSPTGSCTSTSPYSVKRPATCSVKHSAYSAPLRSTDPGRRLAGGDSRVGRDVAAGHDYRLLVLADVCDDPDPQLHRALIDSVLPMQADILDLAAFESAVGVVSTR